VPKEHKYQTIARQVARLLAAAPEGELLPSDRELSRQHACNVLTIRKVLQPFVARGLVIRKTGSGSFRSELPYSAAPDATRFGLLLHQQGGAFASAAAHALATTAQRRRVQLTVGWTTDFGADADAEVEKFRQEKCGAVLIPWAPATQFSHLQNFLKRAPLPVGLAFLLRHFEDCCFEHPSCFGNDIQAQITTLYQYLQTLGYPHVAYLGPNLLAAPNLERAVSIYTGIVSSSGADNLCVLAADGAAAMDKIAAKLAPYRGSLGVLAYDDAHALRLLAAMHKLPLAAPDDFAIIGNNNTQTGLHADPPLTSIEHDYEYLSTGLLDYAMARVRGKIQQTREPKHWRLVVRQSCGGAAKITAKLRRAIRDGGGEITLTRTAEKT
jgi:DNA-binding LacI/PurR family transcriptional regulator